MGRKLKPNKFEIREDHVCIFLESPRYGVKECLVDLEDWPKVRGMKWDATSISKTNKTHYAQQNHHFSMMMHRLIMSFPVNLQIDHINHDGLDNRKSNLRVVTARQNSQNKATYANNLVGYKGVYYRKYKNGSSAYRVRIRVNGELIDLGQTRTLEEAVIVRRAADRKYFRHPNEPEMEIELDLHLL